VSGKGAFTLDHFWVVGHAADNGDIKGFFFFGYIAQNIKR